MKINNPYITGGFAIDSDIVAANKNELAPLYLTTSMNSYFSHFLTAECAIRKLDPLKCQQELNLCTKTPDGDCIFNSLYTSPTERSFLPTASNLHRLRQLAETHLKCLNDKEAVNKIAGCYNRYYLTDTIDSRQVAENILADLPKVSWFDLSPADQSLYRAFYNQKGFVPLIVYFKAKTEPQTFFQLQPNGTPEEGYIILRVPNASFEAIQNTHNRKSLPKDIKSLTRTGQEIKDNPASTLDLIRTKVRAKYPNFTCEPETTPNDTMGGKHQGQADGVGLLSMLVNLFSPKEAENKSFQWGIVVSLVSEDQEAVAELMANLVNRNQIDKAAPKSISAPWGKLVAGPSGSSNTGTFQPEAKVPSNDQHPPSNTDENTSWLKYNYVRTSNQGPVGLPQGGWGAFFNKQTFGRSLLPSSYLHMNDDECYSTSLFAKVAPVIDLPKVFEYTSDDYPTNCPKLEPRIEELSSNAMACSFDEIETKVDQAISQAADKYNLPASYLKAIYTIESAPFIHKTKEFTCTLQEGEVAVGPFQIVYSTYVGVMCGDEKYDQVDYDQCVSDDDRLHPCNVFDAAELAARILRDKVGAFSCENNSSTLSHDELYRAACLYYGTMEPDTTTITYGTGYGLTNANYCDIVMHIAGLN